MTSDRPELSIVIVSFECGDHLLTLLADLETARRDVDLEVRVIDNASSDGTAALAGERYPWVEVTALTENIGFGRASNRGIAAACSDIVLLLNPDTRVRHSALRACIDELRRVPDVGVLTPRVLTEDGQLDRRCLRGFPTPWGVFCHVSGLDRILRDRRSRRYTLGWLSHDRAADVDAVSGAVMFCRADALRQVGGFDETFFMYGEDIDLCLRVCSAGWKVRYWPHAEITHLGGKSGWTSESRKAWRRSLATLQLSHRRGPAARIGAGLLWIGGRMVPARATRRPGESRRDG